jgi:hypothetical protein
MLWTNRTQDKLQTFAIVDQLVPTISGCRTELHHLYTCPVFLSETSSNMMRDYILIHVKPVTVNNRTDGDSHTAENHSLAYAPIEHSPSVLGRPDLNSGRGHFIYHCKIFHCFSQLLQENSEIIPENKPWYIPSLHSILPVPVSLFFFLRMLLLLSCIFYFGFFFRELKKQA